MQSFTICLWFDTEAREAAEFYVSIFPNSKIGSVAYYTKEGVEFHGKPEGSVLTVEFELNGNKFIGLNGGPRFKPNEAVSFVINCKDQEEVDYYWDKLSEGGDPAAQQCGWLKDKYGISWQVEPVEFTEMINSGDKEKVERAMKLMFTMKKLDINMLKEAFDKID